MSDIALTLSSGRVALSGLIWDTNPQTYGRTEARVRARERHSTSFLLRAGERNLALCIGETPAIGAHSFAGALADQLPEESWAGVFKTSAGYVFVAVDDRCVHSDSDKLFQSEQEVRNRFDQERKLYPVSFCPSTWNIEDARDSEAALRAIKWDVAALLQPIKSNAPRTKAIGLVVAILLTTTFVGYQAWHSWREKEIQRELAAQRPPPPPPDPWILQPRPMDALAVCNQARLLLSTTTRQGWELTALVCDFAGHAVSATLTPYTTQSVPPILPPAFKAQLAADGSVMNLTANLSAPIADRRVERPSQAGTLAARNFVFAHTETPSWQLAGRRAQFEMASEGIPDTIAAGLQQLPTASLIRIEFKKEAWHVQGEIYN